MLFKSKKASVVLTIIIISLSILLVSFASLLFNQTQLSLGNTVEYSATVSKFDIIDKDNSYAFEITTEEYGATLLTDSSVKGYLKNFQGELPKSGSKIIFRIENYDSDISSDTDFAYIVSLSTNIGDIFTLEDYNFEANRERVKLLTIHIIAIAVLLTVMVYRVIIFAKKRRNNTGDGSMC